MYETTISKNLLHSEEEVVSLLNDLKNDKFQRVVRNIKSGSFKRLPEQPDYQDRLIYTQALRTFVYDPSILNLIFSDLELKTLFFRVFGYQGEVDFTIYPQCWLRDLPLLDFGHGVYLGDGILLGTNQISIDQQTIKVGPIKIGDHTIFDQRCAVGYRTEIGKNCVIGYQVSIGIKGSIGENVRIGALTVVAHGTKIGNNVMIGDQSKIGSFVCIDDGVILSEFSEVPSFSHVTKEGIFSRRKAVIATN